MDDTSDNPFKLPPDDQIFLIRKQERESRAQEREKVKTLKVHEKTTASSRVHKNRRVDDGTDESQLREMAAKKVKGSGRTESVGRDPRREKENVGDFVAKKREMFLVQMGLDVKRAEINKLVERARQKDEALSKSEQMIDEDVTRFDLFLQNNDQKAHKAMKDAEDMTKKKQDKVTKIKTLKASLSAIQSEIAKHREQLQECIKYKKFLKKLTPQEWKDQTKEEQLQRKSSRKKHFVDQKMAETNRLMSSEIEAEERLAEEREKEAKGKRRKNREDQEEAKERERDLERRRRMIRKKYPTQEAVEEQYVEIDSGEEMPLYFEEPAQLTDVFTSLEESNLFLIQNSQDTEQALEEYQQQFANMKREWDAKTNRMKQKIEEDERVIQVELAECEHLRTIVSQKRAGTKQDELLAQLRREVYEVHVACGHDADNNPDTLEMLKAIEAKLEEFLTYLDEAEATGFKEQVEDMERKKKRERRDLIRKHNKDQNDRRNEERLKASLERSQAPVHKKVGKQIMFRSAPLFQQRKVVEEDDGFEEAKRDHGVFGIWLDRGGDPYATEPMRLS